jgi:PAS domain S-box-containing protein
MDEFTQNTHRSARKKFLELSLKTTRKSYYPQLQKQLENAQANERSLQLLIDSLPAQICYVSDEERFVLVNREFENVSGMAKKQVLGRQMKHVLGARNYEKITPHIKAALSGQSGRAEFSVAAQKDLVSFYEINYVPEIDTKGRVGGFYLLTIDLTERKEAEREISSLRNYLSNIIDSMPSILIGVDKKNRVTQWNLKASQKTGISPEAAIGRRLETVFPQFAIELDHVSTSIESRNVYYVSRHPRVESDKQIYEDITIYPLTSNGVEGAVIRIDDVTEQVQMEELMIQSEKILSVGGLAAGMAHEINNPLAGMMQSANVMKNRLGGVDMPANLKVAEELGISMGDIKLFMEKREIFRMLDAIQESGSRAAEIVSNMLSFARKSDTSSSSHYPDQLMDESIELAATDYDLKKQYDFKSIEIIKEYAQDLPMLLCEGAKIQQVLLNILRNGAQAMQAAKIQSPKFIIRIYKKEASGMVCMEIDDNGPGMDDATKSKVFDPFFTTKPVGVGTGLGLSVSYFIVTENHKGTLTVLSEPGKGANFIIGLPVHDKTP